MALLSQLLGNRDLAWEDNLEKGRIWVYQEGNEYTKFCNQFCWNAPGTGKVIIEAWGASGSGARQCCCAFSVPGNPGAYVKKCICVIVGNRVCGCLGFSCGNSGDRDYRGRSEPTMVCWQGCAPHALYGTFNPLNKDNEETWKGNNPWGWGNGENLGSTQQCRKFGWNETTVTVCGNQLSICCAEGATAGCMCAQGGNGGYSYCTNNPSPYSCGVGGIRFCGHNWGAVDMCNTSQSPCGMLCNIFNARCRYFNWAAWARAFGGDLNCCGTISCKSYHNCVNNCQCAQQWHLTTSPGKYSSEGAVISYSSNQDSPMSRTSGSPGVTALLAIQAATPWPSWGFSAICTCSYAGCGCYEDMGCHRNMPAGVPGAGASVCGDVRDGGYAGGHGSVRIKFIPDAGQSAY
jgi:hypothetical protein